MSDRTDGYGLLSHLREIERQLRRLHGDWNAFRESPTADALSEVKARTGRILAALDRLAASAEPQAGSRLPAPETSLHAAGGGPSERPEPRAVVAASRQIDSMLWEVTRRWRELAFADLDPALERIVILLRRMADRCSTLIMATGGWIDRSAGGAGRSARSALSHDASHASRGERLRDLVTEIDGRLWQLQTDWQHMRQRPAAERLHLLMETSEAAAAAGETLREALRHVGGAEVRRALRVRRHMAEGSPFLPYRDPLTGAYNREGFDSLAGAELKRCRRYGRPFGLLAVRLSPPDLPGLRRALACVRSELREYDLVARHSGESILIGLPEAGPGATRRVASRVIRALRENHMETWFQQLSYATVPEDGATLGGLIDAACDRLRA